MNHAPLYHRLLRLRHYQPGPVMTAVLFEGSIAVSALLALAELLNWWSVLAIPLTVAAMVKFNDVVAGLARRPPRRPPARGVARGRAPSIPSRSC
ncbi:MAG: hypothetical protein IRY85_05035 [Micromonosporaceae bacterium]|nr:hypothetical protein [Micromonosporaceae bacterium]